MRQTTSLIILIIAILIIACQKPNRSIITCSIDGLDNDSAVVAIMPQSDLDIEIYDTVQFKNGKLNYNYQVNELTEFIIIPFSLFYKFDNGRKYPLSTSRITVFLNENERVIITGKIDRNYLVFNTEGNELSEQLAVVRNKKTPFFQESINNEYVYNKSIKPSQLEEDAYWKKRNEIITHYDSIDLNYIRTNLDKDYSARLLLGFPNENLVSQLYDNFSLNVKNSFYGQMLGDIINGWVITNPGIKFPNIFAKTIDDKDFSLNELQGKFVLIDFWGSWCAPCLSEIPELRNISQKFDSSLALIGIACSDNIDNLNKAIIDNQIDWTQILEGKTRETNYSQRFGVRSFPTKVLLDKNGVVVKTYNGTDKSLFSDLDSLIGNKNYR